MIKHDNEINQVLSSIPEILFLFKSGRSIDELSKLFMLDTLIIEGIVRAGLKIQDKSEFTEY